MVFEGWMGTLLGTSRKNMLLEKKEIFLYIVCAHTVIIFSVL
jgi:hypothetical protein